MDFIDSARVGSFVCLILLIIIDATCSREGKISQLDPIILIKKIIVSGGGFFFFVILITKPDI